MQINKKSSLLAQFFIFVVAMSLSEHMEPLLAKTPNQKQIKPVAKPAAKSVAKPPVKSAETQKVLSEDDFMKQLGDKVQAQLDANRPKNLNSATQAVLLIKMNKVGQVEEVKIDTSSGVPDVDEAALQAVRKAAPFGKLPTKFPDGLALKYTFRFGASKPQPLSVDEKRESDSYMQKVREKISRSWRSPEVSKKCKVTVYFLIEASGKIKTLSLKQTSGLKIVDDAALAAIKRAGPFDPLPPVWKSGYGVEYTLAGGPKNDIEHYKFNDVSLPDGDFQISRGGAKLHPLEYNKKIENQLQSKQWAAEDKLKSLQSQLDSTSSQKAKSDLLFEIGKTCLELHQFDQAIKSFLDASEIEAQVDASSVKYALVLKGLAESYKQNNELDKACLSYQKCIDILKSKGTENGVSLNELKDSMTGYAKALYKQNKVKEGDAVYAEIKTLK